MELVKVLTVVVPAGSILVLRFVSHRPGTKGLVTAPVQSAFGFSQPQEAVGLVTCCLSLSPPPFTHKPTYTVQSTHGGSARRKQRR